MKEAFSRFFAADPDRLHAAAHSHHPWPDVSYQAHMQAWEDAARFADDKWEQVFEELLPDVRSRVAAVLGLADPGTLVFAPNTHEFVVRIVSNLEWPLRVLTTGNEFHSFARQLTRWEEAGLATATRVPAQPFADFPQRLMDAYRGHDLVYLSHVHFDSGYVTLDLERIVEGLDQSTTVVIDGYHGFMALPTDLARIADRVFYLAGGYKYAMAGEGACFLHVPPAAPARPVDTGWFAGFGDLTGPAPMVRYSRGGQRFAGSTMDPTGLYRMRAVLSWLEEEGIGVAAIHRHVRQLQDLLLSRLPTGLLARWVDVGEERGHFLTFELADAGDIYRRLYRRKVVTDYRSDRWRVGLGIYHDENDIERLADEIAAATGGKGM